MDITYFGHSSFKIKSKTASVITDPYLPSGVGFKYPKSEADIITVSHAHQDHNAISMIDGSPMVITDPGEYEVKGISIFGYPSFHDDKMIEGRSTNTIFVIEAEGLRICHLGDLGTGISTKILEELSEVDILMIPVGGKVTIGPKEAVDLISKIEPSIVLPMHFKAEGINEALFGELEVLETFLKEMGAEGAEKLDKLTLTKDKLPEETKVILLERKS